MSALGQDLLNRIKNSTFCILGCGAVGSIFAEMLVRSGGCYINLVDGDKVELSNLNRCPAFFPLDEGKFKTEVIKEKLITINPKAHIETANMHFRERYASDIEDLPSHKLIREADIVIVAMDTNKSRILCEKMCNEKNILYMSVGVGIEKKGTAFYEIIWKPETPVKHIDGEGYGVGSYASIVMEASAAGFGMLLSHLNSICKGEASSYKYLYRKYDNFIPEERQKIKK